MSDSPVVVIGAGPVGLAAAAELVARGLPTVVLEAGSRAGTTVREWRHVRLFSRWSEVIAPAAARLLEQHGWRAPDPDGHPTGGEWADEYLRPLADALGGCVRYGVTVIGAARRGRDRVVDAGRENTPLTLRLHTADGERRMTARALIDASGTWNSPNPLGADGLPALGETEAADRITYRIPEPAEVTEYAGGHIVVAGSGHSALTALVTLAHHAPTARVTWLLRRGAVGSAFGGGAADQLPARGALGERAREAVEVGRITVRGGFRVEAVQRDGDRLTLVSTTGDRIEEIDQVIALTGFRPDLSPLSELRVALDPILQAPVALAPLIDPNTHSCGTVYPHGAAELSHPEPDVYLVGMKSYGRAPTFLAMTGYEQVRSIAAALAGDHEAASRVELVLPETGVCGGAGVFDEPAAGESTGCCATGTESTPLLPSVG